MRLITLLDKSSRRVSMAESSDLADLPVTKYVVSAVRFFSSSKTLPVFKSCSLKFIITLSLYSKISFASEYLKGCLR